MMSKVELRKKIGENSGDVKLLSEIETISKALYLEKNPSRTSISAPGNRSKPTRKSQLLDPKSKIIDGNEDSSQKDKKSFWNWKPLKALSNVRNRKFNCCFSLLVHSIEGFPSSFENLSICVHWKRRDGELVTRPVKVFEGIAEFEEKLTHTCLVYGSRTGPHHLAKYEAKHFLLYASVIGVQELDLGKHRVDLTRLLPLTLVELEDEKSSGKWTTSFKLSGEAKGAMMNVSFGYTVVGDSQIPLGNNQNVPELFNLKQNNAKTVKPVPKFGQGDRKSTIRHTEGLPGALKHQHYASSGSVKDVKDLHELLPTSKSQLAVLMQYEKVNEEKLDSSFNYKPELDAFTECLDPMKSNYCSVSKSRQDNVENECEDGEFSVIEQGVELLKEEQKKPLEVADKANNDSLVDDKIDGSFHISSQEVGRLHPHDEGNASNKDELMVHDCNIKEDEICSKEYVMKELEAALSNVTNLETQAFYSPEQKENYMEIKTDYESNRNESSLSLDDVTESVANDFLDMLGIELGPLVLSSESEPESPRERLLRQFEKDALAGGYSMFDFGVDIEDQIECDHNTSTVSEWGNFSEDFDLLSVIQDPEEQQMRTQAESGKTRAKVLEDLETETLMREWGLSDEAFRHSPPENSGGFGSPIDLSPEEPLELPPLGEGLGSFLQTNNGGFLRSMNPSLFRSAKSGGILIMQVSSPVVVPAEMGSGIMDILQQLASVGIEKLSMQANKLMPLEDITGKTMQQVAWEAAASLEGPERQSSLQHELEIGQDVSGEQKNVKERSSAPRSNRLKSSKIGNVMGSEYVSFEDLAPLAMDKIEALSFEGLRIQSGLSDEDAASSISAESIGEISSFKGKGINFSGSLGLEGAAGLQLLDIKDSSNDIDGLMDLSLTLDEWMRLDSGDIGDEDQISEQTSKILAAHHASSLDLIRGGSKGERRHGKGSGRKCGLLGNNFTVALMVQLRDPLRNYEPVGTPMLALIQVERVFVPPKPKIYCKVSEVRNDNEGDDESELVVKEKLKDEEKASEEEEIPQFCISEAHVTGLKTEPSKKKLWGTTAQQQSGSRWLLANGMGKSNKQPFRKSKTISIKPATPLTKYAKCGDKIWSISSHILGSGSK
ncbi:hypothetical protein P3X46_007588 [Hevea brasiliensis]|uniref:C2 NT-type domain-containing protein n=1 Tax=Hevea brasiliensis TaxID=3981 RepID=A0ABQ9MWH3_HEVBR|nr:protein PLASTID MOVEMENT IMPAIRED 1-RELATED 1 [Hevea brasiliensis]XP_021641175.2 protein PLASTID MOVEMENT IMPAIRED 1-RELATED 1 [Hevea brasiliensis]KAJ9183777.1 hypothetical protein P3X46_007588 [Hevea brasiliensis]